MSVRPEVQLVSPGQFDPEKHFYPKVMNAHIHPLMRALMSLGNERIAERYCHLHPEASGEAVHAALAYCPVHFRWGGADLFHVTTEHGVRRIVVIETNSCPSGQKSMPRVDESDEQAGYRTLIERALLPLLRRRGLPRGDLAVLYDKNLMEASGYAAALADATSEPVHLVPVMDGAAEPTLRCVDEVLEVRNAAGEWCPVRAALRYVTQRPWNRIPAITRTAVLNPVVVCLAGGRNKMLAAKAYDLYNADLYPHGLQIHTPETIWDVTKPEIPLWVSRMGGVAVIKVPYSNAGQGVYTITSARELEAFMAQDHRYGRFIIQALIGNIGWSSRSTRGRLYHVGTVPNRKNEIHVNDLRFMVGASPEGFFPVAVYARRAREALAKTLGGDGPSWDMLGTNLSFRAADGTWGTETDRLLLMDSRDFNRLGLGLDDLLEAYIQTVLSMTAIDRMADGLVTQKGRFRKRFFRSLNPDEVLLKEILD